MLAPFATLVLLIVAATSSPEWRHREQLLQHVKNRAAFDLPQGRPVFALIPFGIAVGIPAALGLIPANIMVLLGALVACMVGRSYLSRPERPELGGWTPAHGWFLALSWSLLAVPLHVSSLDLVDALAAQTALGPAPLFFGPATSAAMWIALLAGLGAAAGWVAGLPRLSRPPTSEMQALDTVVRWGESALAGTAVAAVLWGPSLGAFVAGPVRSGTFVMAGVSFVVTAGAVAAVSYGRRFFGRATDWGFAAGAALLSLMAMMVAAFVR